MSWSYLYRGKVALVIIKKITPIIIFKLNQKVLGIKKLEKTGNHPPKNKIAQKVLISNIFAYSPKKNNANAIAEYSTLYPDTSSASASGKSKGCLFVSASIEIEKIKKIGSNGTINQICCCEITILLRLNDPVQITTFKIVNPIEISYDSI